MKKEQEAQALIDPLYTKMDNGESLDDYQQGVLDTITWLFDDADKPEVED